MSELFKVYPPLGAVEFCQETEETENEADRAEQQITDKMKAKRTETKETISFLIRITP